MSLPLLGKALKRGIEDQGGESAGADVGLDLGEGAREGAREGGRERALQLQADARDCLCPRCLRRLLGIGEVE